MGGFRNVASQTDPLATALGYKGWTFNTQVNGAGLALTSQEIDAYAIWLPHGAVISNVLLNVQTAGSGVAPTGFFAGLASPTAMVAQSANLASSSSLTTLGIQAFPLSSPYTTNPTDSPTGLYYVVLLQNGAFTVTNVAIARTVTVIGYGLNHPLWGVLGTAQTALPANGAAISFTGAAGICRWAAVS